uniref:RING-type E3 ubiquitin transferase n=1 Tax=Cynoglossus semilaevis TaxID=244447 RepID=A0A3P8VN83_CYNSE
MALYALLSLICLEIFLEPVTLPCTHTFCKDCFLESVDKAALSCPLCRRRVSTWVRANSRNNTLVNEQLWQRIQISFPQQCERRRVGQAPEDEFGGGQQYLLGQRGRPKIVLKTSLKK